MVSRITRAKQFLPFDALKGLKEALREKEKEIEYEEKRELSEESLEELEEEFNKINIGSIVKIKYYKNRQYIEAKGEITKIDYNKKRIQIDKMEEINISDILSITI